jgi:hypothetical protein
MCGIKGHRNHVLCAECNASIRKIKTWHLQVCDRRPGQEEMKALAKLVKGCRSQEGKERALKGITR